MSSGMVQHKRSRVMESIREGWAEVVVCTDALARGVDLPTVEYVVNYDVPSDILTYIHRAGRTARAGRVGTVLTLCEDANSFREFVEAAVAWGTVGERRVLGCEQVTGITVRAVE
uniref:ATP-dependent RNA helicase n=1 Tax=Lygus hesperus TaxID=30085 RepID=A0A0A9Y798_LYGHE